MHLGYFPIDGKPSDVEKSSSEARTNLPMWKNTPTASRGKNLPILQCGEPRNVASKLFRFLYCPYRSGRLCSGTDLAPSEQYLTTVFPHFFVYCSRPRGIWSSRC